MLCIWDSIKCLSKRLLVDLKELDSRRREQAEDPADADPDAEPAEAVRDGGGDGGGAASDTFEERAGPTFDFDEDDMTMLLLKLSILMLISNLLACELNNIISEIYYMSSY